MKKKPQDRKARHKQVTIKVMFVLINIIYLSYTCVDLSYTQVYVKNEKKDEKYILWHRISIGYKV